MKSMKVWTLIMAIAAGLWGTYNGFRSWDALNAITDEKVTTAGSTSWDIKSDRCEVGRNC